MWSACSVSTSAAVGRSTAIQCSPAHDAANDRCTNATACKEVGLRKDHLDCGGDTPFPGSRHCGCYLFRFPLCREGSEIFRSVYRCSERTEGKRRGQGSVGRD